MCADKKGTENPEENKEEILDFSAQMADTILVFVLTNLFRF